MDAQPPVVGVIGLGLLGTALAERLLGAGFSVLGYDVDADRGQALHRLGGQAAGDPQELCQRCNFILLSLPTSDVAASVAEQLADALHAGTTIVDTTTGDPQQMIAIGESLAERQANYLEANVAGSSSQARAGTATIFLGGDVAAIDAAETVLSKITPHRIHLGPVGAASKFKLVHNLILGLHRAVLAEGLHFAQSLGFSADHALRILRQTPAASAVMATKGEKMATRTYDVQARLSQHLKDVRLILQEAERVGSPLPLSELHRQLLERAEALGFGDADNSAIIEAYYADSGTD